MNNAVYVIIVEGLDASGKESLTNAIVDKLETEINETCKVIKEEFPRYGTRTGETIKRILYGELKDMKPELPKFFEMDRTDYMTRLIEKQIKADVYVFDRYARSNVYCNLCREDVIEASKKEMELMADTIKSVNPDKEIRLIEICINYDFTNEETLAESVKLHESYMGTRGTLDENETLSKQMLFAKAMEESYDVYDVPEYRLHLGFDIDAFANNMVKMLGYSFKEYKVV